jgi:uncharacterized protein (DUF58 family)
MKRAMRRTIQTCRAGSAYIAISIFLGVMAVNSSNNLLYLTTAVLLGYMLASGLAGRGNVRAASVSFSFPEEIYAEIPCAVTVRVTNKNRFFPIFLIEVSLRRDNETRRVLFSVIQPGKSESRTLFTVFSSRGRHEAGEAELSSVYPFNFLVRYWPVGFETTVTVFPHPLRCEPALAFLRQNDEKEGEIPGSIAETDIVGVRPYMEGDSMKRIHWKSSARTGKLKTRLYDGSASRSARVIDLDRLVIGGVERGLSMAAYSVMESLKSGLPVGLSDRGEVILPSAERVHKRDILTRLALYDEK